MRFQRIEMQHTKVFVAIAGNIGSGKTTLTQKLSECFGWQSFYESVEDNPYLTDFYANMHRWSFPIQIHFLQSRFRSHKQINQNPNSAIQDRSIYEDAHIFARNLYESRYLEGRDYKNYLGLYEEMCEHLNPPDLLIYLRKSLPTLKRNIAKRGRDYERSIPENYLSQLNLYYDEWIQSYSMGKVLTIESDGLDFCNSPNDFEKICLQIFESLDQKDFFLGFTSKEIELS